MQKVNCAKTDQGCSLFLSGPLLGSCPLQAVLAATEA